MLAVFARTEPARPGLVAWWRRPTLRWAIPLGVGIAAATVLIWVELPRMTKTPAALQTMARMEAPRSAPAPAVAPQAARQAAATDAGAPRPREQPAPAAPAREIDAVSRAAPERAAPLARAAASPQTAPTGQTQVNAAPPAPSAAPGVPPSPTTSSLQQKNPASAPNATGRDVFGALEGLPSSVVVSEFVGSDQAPASSRLVTVGGRGRGGSAGVGRGAGAAESVFQAPASPPTPTTVHWRILANGGVERSTSGGAYWEPVAIDPPAFITAGNAPASRVCWLVGRDGVVLRSADGVHFDRLTAPDPSNLTFVRAVDATHATVTTVSGRTFTTVDGGLSWQSPLQDFPTSPF
jgi:hypothetical protein